MKLHRVEVLSRERFGNHVLLRYRWTRGAPEPGQFVMVRPLSSAREALAPFLHRPLFTHDYCDGVMDLLFEVLGLGTALLAEEGAELMVSEPLGRGFTLGGGPVALVGGGVWVSPLKLLSKQLSRSRIPHDVYLEVPKSAPISYGAWISENYPDATLVPTNRSEKGAQAVLRTLGDLGRYTTVYASGPTEMLTAVREASGGVVPAQLAVRERMACAKGSCYGCAVPVWESGARTYARACVEGPIFRAETLAW